MKQARKSIPISIRFVVVLTLLTQLQVPAEPAKKSKSDAKAVQENLEFRAAIGAHHLCSGLWVVGRDYQRTPVEVVAQDLAPFNFFGWESDFKYHVDEERRLVTVTAPGAPPRSARYTGDQGSTILPRGKDNVFFKPVSVPRRLPDAATQTWPMGDVGATEPVPNGVDVNAVAAALDWAMEQKEQNTRAFVVACDGKIIGERYAPGWTKHTPQISWSQGKSITATLIGILVQGGLLEIDQPAPLKEWQGEGDPRSKIRIRDLLQMSSGLDFTNLGYDYLFARDWVRFGLLYLQDGVWQGERILPEGWTKFVATPAPADKKEDYGGMFWLNRSPRMDQVPKDAYWSAGFMGQVTMVIPSRNLVVVRMGPSPGGFYPYLNETVCRILKAIP